MQAARSDDKDEYEDELFGSKLLGRWRDIGRDGDNKLQTVAVGA